MSASPSKQTLLAKLASVGIGLIARVTKAIWKIEESCTSHLTGGFGERILL